ncbi:hypothetical protein [Actinoplanes sp. NPDC051851]|uniref:hypothetical protein n=1 Tax=Actinoplanes sp. NPDC051851 TaxID=3154753 RepID=UPI00343CAA43
MGITVAAGSTFTLRCPDTEPISLVSVAEVRAPFLAELPPIPVLSLDDGPGVRRIGVCELVSSAGLTWVDAELRDGLLTVLGDSPAPVVQRRDSVRRAGLYPAHGTALVVTRSERSRVPITGAVQDISMSGLLLRGRATNRTAPHLPTGILRVMLHIAMPWGEMTVTVATVDQRSDRLRGSFEWISPESEGPLAKYVATGT